MGRTLFEWFKVESFENLVFNKIKDDNVHFKWLIMSPESPFLPIIEKNDETSLGNQKLPIVIQKLTSIRKKLFEKLQNKLNKLEVRTFSHVPLSCSILVIDDKLYVMEYLEHMTSDECPLYCIVGENSAWSSSHQKSFQEIWEKSQDLFEGGMNTNIVPFKRNES